MSLHVKHTRADGSTVVGDSQTTEVWILKPGQWEEIAHLPYSEQRTRIDQFVEANRADPTGGRTELEQTMVDNASQGQGEAHEQTDEAR